jgi:hypothetical protein
MKNFILFFEEKEGSTAVMQSLDTLDLVSVVRRETDTGRGGWEPFEWFNCGSLGRDRFRRCLHEIYGPQPLNLAQLNSIYMRTARAPIRDFDKARPIGLKMRITPPWDIPNLSAASPYRRSEAVDLATKVLRRLNRGNFKRLMAQTLAELNVAVFIMVRQDIFRWAISKYHGDGTGKPGHLQFKLASGAVDSESIPRIAIDPDRFGKLIEKCVELHEVKRWWADGMQEAGISVHALRYEDFVGNRVEFFSSLLKNLGVVIRREELEARLDRGIPLKRVHGSDISEYVANHCEISSLYGERYIAW